MKKLIFRILGALASALIIVAVFVPFVSVTGFSQSLWQAHEATGTLYLPIMIIVFGAIGVIFFSINIKTELAYTSSGALLFFMIMQTIPIIDQGTFKSLSVGYYFLAIGSVLTGLMAFLCNLKTKNKEVIKQPEEPKEVSVINQLDKLYDNQVSSNVQSQTMVDNVIQPLQIQPDLSNNINPINNENMNIEVNQNIQTSNNNVSEITQQSQLNVEIPVQELQPIQATEQPSTSGVNSVISEFDTSTQTMNNVSNPVVSEFSNNATIQSSPNEQNVVSANPVVSEFTMNSTPTQVNEPIISPQVQPEPSIIEPVEQQGTTAKVDVLADPTNNSSNNLDIFG